MFFVMVSIFNFYFRRLSLLFPWNDYAYKTVRYPGLNQIGSRQVTHPSKGRTGVKNMSSLWQNTVFFRMFSVSFFFISGDAASYFIGMIMLIS